MWVSIQAWVRCVSLSVGWSLSLCYFPSSFLSSIGTVFPTFGLHVAHTHTHCDIEIERVYTLWQMLKLYLVLSRRMFGIVVHYSTYCCWVCVQIACVREPVRPFIRLSSFLFRQIALSFPVVSTHSHTHAHARTLISALCSAFSSCMH